VNINVDAAVQSINVSHSTTLRTKRSFNAASRRCLPAPEIPRSACRASAWRFDPETQVALGGLHRSVLRPSHRVIQSRLRLQKTRRWTICSRQTCSTISKYSARDQTPSIVKELGVRLAPYSSRVRQRQGEANLSNWRRISPPMNSSRIQLVSETVG
jgi:hypothetical protein